MIHDAKERASSCADISCFDDSMVSVQLNWQAIPLGMQKGCSMTYDPYSFFPATSVKVAYSW